MVDKVLSGCRILIVEDNYYQAQECRFILENAGAVVVALSATVPDLETIQCNGQIDAALVDINLGHSVSFDFARELAQHGTPFAFLTGYDQTILPDDLAKCPHISKPADSEGIVAVLKNLMRSKV